MTINNATSKPLVSIVMPVYNAGPYLLDAIASVAEQSFEDWELICINDGSRDGSGDLLEWFATRDSRVTVLHQANQGIVKTLNRGIEAARGSLIARMDGDDICLPDRLAMQVEFLGHNSQVVALGGAILHMDSDGDPMIVESPATDHAEIEARLLTRKTGLFHPTTIMRASHLRAVGGYRSEFEWVEDHDLWLRLAQRGQLANLSDVVLCYRQHASSVCWNKANTQRERMNELLKVAYQARGRTLPAQVILDHAATRSPAGHGKWARAAARGGSIRTAIKHLRGLWREPAKLRYRFRMTGEVLLRLVGSLPKGLFSKSTAVPKFREFQAEYARHAADLANKQAQAA